MQSTPTPLNKKIWGTFPIIQHVTCHLSPPPIWRPLHSYIYSHPKSPLPKSHVDLASPSASVSGTAWGAQWGGAGPVPGEAKHPRPNQPPSRGCYVPYSALSARQRGHRLPCRRFFVCSSASVILWYFWCLMDPSGGPLSPVPCPLSLHLVPILAEQTRMDTRYALMKGREARGTIDFSLSRGGSSC